jgi:FlaA1/EpsC-like NDP-sugar epimerase
VLNNVTGSPCLSEAVIHYGLETFVLISTDKAANPSDVMGATKRFRELYVQALGQDAVHRRTVFCADPFGNVGSSSGSVEPSFLQQIERGQPVTLIHPEITRYFMTIPEAI